MKGCRPLTENEVYLVAKSFWGEYRNRDKALFLLGIKSGFRISELLSLQVGDVWKDGKMVARVAVQRRNMKRKIEGRTVVLHPKAQEALQVWVKELLCDKYGPYATFGADTFVFVSRKGQNKPVSRIHAWRILHTVFEDNAFDGKLGTHSMRKTFANNVYHNLCQRRSKGEAVDPFRLTSKALGHKNINSTDQYLSFLEEDIDQAILAV